ncbi:MAG: SDR family NAD(P)-dependent oxidoreductase [Bacteroidales bacterium]|nr:SDR family NAD(P)-dependent oxidoreductase [Bacteroidales bacterium]
MNHRPKVVLITGGSSGIGYEASQLLAQQGHRVYAAARRTELMEPLKAAGVVPLPLDVTNEQSRQQCVAAVVEAEGRIDVLVNNAGYGFFGAIECVPLGEARRQMEVNVFGLAEMCRLVLPTMRRQHSGRIINIASIAGRAVFPMGGWYNVSKYSVEALSDALRMELRPLGIEVAIIEPGCISTDWGRIAADHLEQSSRGTAYESFGLGEAALLRWAYTGQRMSPPSAIARTIARAATARRPRTRYRLGRFSTLTTLGHALLPTRCWDALLMKLMSTQIKTP